MKISTQTNSRNSARRGLRRCAFSLVEWMVVLVIIGMVLALVIPRLGIVPGSVRVTKTTGAVRSAFSTALNMAMATGEPIKVTMDFSSHQLTLEKLGQGAADPYAIQPLDAEDDPERPRGSIFKRLKLFPFDEETELNTEVVEEPDDPAILSYRFYPNGEAVGPEIPIRLAGRWLTIDVDRLTGKPLIREQEAYDY